MASEKPKQVIIIVDGVRFEIDYSEADDGLMNDISRIIKGLLTILEKRVSQHT